MTYDAWKCASPEEGVELAWDDSETTSVDECAHGEHPIECSLCTSAGFHAAVSGEEEDMEPEITSEKFVESIAAMSPMSLVSMRNAIDAELKRRREALSRELAATEHALNGTAPRKTRKDAGTTRPRKEVAA